MNQSEAAEATRGSRLTDLRQVVSAAEVALGRLYAAIEKGTIEVVDPVLKGRVAGHKLKRDEAAGLVRMLENNAAAEKAA